MKGESSSIDEVDVNKLLLHTIHQGEQYAIYSAMWR